MHSDVRNWPASVSLIREARPCYNGSTEQQISRNKRENRYMDFPVLPAERTWWLRWGHCYAA
jgi:hypothetical protein